MHICPSLNKDYYIDHLGPSRDLDFDLAILSGAKAAQVKNLADFDDLAHAFRTNVERVVNAKIHELEQACASTPSSPVNQLRLVHLHILEKFLQDK